MMAFDVENRLTQRRQTGIHAASLVQAQRAINPLMHTAFASLSKHEKLF